MPDNIVNRQPFPGPGLAVRCLGAITDEDARTFNVPLSFLTPGKRYVAEIYADAPGANWYANPLPVTISKRSVNSNTSLNVVLAPGGGQAVRITPAR